MFRRLPTTPNRRRIGHFLERSKKFHASCSATVELDVTTLMASLAATRAAGQPVGPVAALVKATALTIAAHPTLNRHGFQDLLGRRFEVAFDHISCGVMVSRKNDAGEDCLVPGPVKHADRLSVHEIHALVQRYKTIPIAELPGAAALMKLDKLPTPVHALVSFKLRSDPAFFEKLIGTTFGLSAWVSRVGVPLATNHALTPMGASFFPGTIRERAWVVEGRVVPRQILPMTVVVDHFLLDGVEVAAALDTLSELVNAPERLGLPAVDPAAAAGASAKAA